MLGRLLVLFKKVFFDPATPASEKGSLAERLSSLTSVFYSNVDQDQRSAVGVKLDGHVLSSTSMPEIRETMECACAEFEQRICSLKLEEIFLFSIYRNFEPDSI